MRAGLLSAVAGLLLFSASAGLAQEETPTGKADAAAAEKRPAMSLSAVGLVRKVEFAVKDLTPAQKKKLLDLAQKFDREIVPLEKAREEDHRASLRLALQTRTRIDSKAREIISGVQQRREERVQQKFADLIGNDVLTPAQRPAWEAYRLHFLTTFHLAFAGATKEQLEADGVLAQKVVKEVKDAGGAADAASRSGPRCSTSG